MSLAEATIIGAGIAAGVALVTSTVSAIVTKRAAERQRRDQLFSRALDFMDGGSQKRNLGIAAIGMFWRQYPDDKELCAQMLIGSAIYLLDESKQGDKSHEIYNLRNIIHQLQELSGVEDQSGYKVLNDTLTMRITNFDPRPAEGLWLAKTDLHGFWKELNPDVPIPVTRRVEQPRRGGGFRLRWRRAASR